MLEREAKVRGLRWPFRRGHAKRRWRSSGWQAPIRWATVPWAGCAPSSASPSKSSELPRRPADRNKQDRSPNPSSRHVLHSSALRSTDPPVYPIWPPRATSTPSTHPVPGEHLCPVLVLNPDDAWVLNPRLSVHLDREALIADDGDPYCMALMMMMTTMSTMMMMMTMAMRSVMITMTLVTWAIRCLWIFITLEIPSWMLPKTATTSRTLSSKDGAMKYWK